MDKDLEKVEKSVFKARLRDELFHKPQIFLVSTSLFSFIKVEKPMKYSPVTDAHPVLHLPCSRSNLIFGGVVRDLQGGFLIEVKTLSSVEMVDQIVPNVGAKFIVLWDNS